MRHNIKYKERTEDHFIGKKKPWQSRLNNPIWVNIAWIVLVMAGIALYILKREWIVFYALFLSIFLWGHTERIKGNYYKLGYDDSTRDQEGKGVINNANALTSKRVTLDLDSRVYEEIENIRKELGVMSRGTVINQILLEVLLADENDGRAEH